MFYHDLQPAEAQGIELQLGGESRSNDSPLGRSSIVHLSQFLQEL